MVKYFSRKHLVAVAIALGLFVVGLSPVLAAYNTVQFTADTTISLSGLGTTITVKDGAKVSSFEVGASTITVVLVGDANGYSNITFESANRYEIDSDDGAKATCGGAGTQLTFTVGDIKTRTIVVSPKASTLSCSSANTSSGTAGIINTGGSSKSQTTQQQTSASTDALRAQITQLLAQVAALQTQLGISSGNNGIGSIVSAFAKNLAYGLKSNSDVKKLQEFLISKGYLKAGLNSGNYLGMTVSAVRAYQKAKGISQTGNVGPLTRAAINAELGK